MDRDEWNNAYANRLQEVSGMEPQWAMECAEAADTDFDDGVNPVEAADEEMTYWDADE